MNCQFSLSYLSSQTPLILLVSEVNGHKFRICCNYSVILSCRVPVYLLDIDKSCVLPKLVSVEGGLSSRIVGGTCPDHVY